MDNNNESVNKQASALDEIGPALDRLAKYRTPVPAAFILVVIFFFFGFSSFKCNGNKVTSLKGINLVTGTHLKTQASGMLNGNPFSAINGNNENSGNTRGQKVPPNFWAILALGSAITGFIVFYRKEKKEALFGTLLGASGFISLFILRLVIKSKVENQGGGMINIETDFLFGYWASLLAFIVAGGISYLRFRKEKNIKPELEDEAPEVQTPTPLHINIITQGNDANS